MTIIKDENEISRTPILSVTGGWLVQKAESNKMQTLQEVIISSGESVINPSDPSVTLETITITRTYAQIIEV